METRGFVTRKVQRLECDRKMAEMRIRSIDETVEELTKEILSLIGIKKRVKRNLAKVNEGISKLKSRLKCEVVEKVAAPKMDVGTGTSELANMF